MTDSSTPQSSEFHAHYPQRGSVNVTDLLTRTIALVLDKLNEHNPETGFLFAIDHGLTEYLTLLTLVHACARNVIPVDRALETIKRMEENHNKQHSAS